MSKRDELATQLEGLRAEIDELSAIEEADLTEEQSARMVSVFPEWDEAKAAHDALVERDDKVAAVRAAAIKPSNREVSTPAVIVRNDPFEDASNVRQSFDRNGSVRMGSDDVIGRALEAFEGKQRGVSDAQLEALVERIETVPGAAEYALVHGSPAYRAGFDEYMRSQGMNPMYTPEQHDAIRASMALGGATGGYALPTLLDPTLIHTGTATKNPLRSISRVVSGTQNVWHGVSTGNVTTYWKAEGSAFTDGSPTLASPSVTAFNLTAYVTGSYEIFEDSNLLSQLPGLIGEAFSYKESTAFVTGGGSTDPKGIVTCLSGTAGVTVTATTRGQFNTASAVDVFALLNAIPSRYEDSATWLGNKATFNNIKQMSTASNGSYFWSDFNAGVGAPLLGSPIAQSSDMATAQTSGTKLLVLGDFSQFLIYDRIGTTVEYIANVVDGSGLPTGQRGLVAHKRVGSDVTDQNAFRIFNT